MAVWKGSEQKTRLPLGLDPVRLDPVRGAVLWADTDAHRLIVAPTGAGKGQGLILPMLRDDPARIGSVVAVDIKGELATLSGGTRWRGRAGPDSVHVFDPFAYVPADKLPPEGRASFNPLQWLRDSGEKNAVDNAGMLAAALVPWADNDGGYWCREGRALLRTFLLFVAFSPLYENSGTLFSVSALLSQSPADFRATLQTITQSEIVGGAVARGAGRMLQKFEKDGLTKEGSGVLSSATSSLDWLESGACSSDFKAAWSSSSLDFGRLRDKVETVYLVIPPAFLETHAGMLRLLVVMARSSIHAKGIKSRNDTSPPVRFVLDEFASLGKMEQIEKGVSLDRGYGIQYTIVVQDLTQLANLYGQTGWKTFISNSGIIQAFATKDHFTAQELSNLTDIIEVTQKGSNSGFGGSGVSFGANENQAFRPRFRPDEIIALGRLKNDGGEVRKAQGAPTNPLHGRAQLVFLGASNADSDVDVRLWALPWAWEHADFLDPDD